MKSLISRDEAKAKGLNRFFMAVECRHGHVADRYVHNGACTVCNRIYAARSVRANPELNNSKSKRAYAKHPEKGIARALARHALRDGKIQPRPCEACGSTERLEMHHDDYSRPYDVKFLCKPCHTRLHFPMVAAA